MSQHAATDAPTATPPAVGANGVRKGQTHLTDPRYNSDDVWARLFPALRLAPCRIAMGGFPLLSTNDELALITRCVRLSRRSRLEYFHDLDFAAAVELASGLTFDTCRRVDR